MKSLKLQPQLNDGYTLEFQGVLIRKMRSSEQRDLVQHIRKEGSAAGIQIVFSPPYFFGEKERLEIEQQKSVWLEIVSNSSEFEDRKNLISGAKLRMSNPKAADFNCSECLKYVPDHEIWEPYKRPGGFLVKREKHHELLCETQKGCPRGTWAEPLALSEKNTLAWNHYWEWRQAGMPLPECLVQRSNWMLLEWITQHGCSRQLCPTIRTTV